MTDDVNRPSKYAKDFESRLKSRGHSTFAFMLTNDRKVSDRYEVKSLPADLPGEAVLTDFVLSLSL
jgi:hypothetical protein